MVEFKVYDPLPPVESLAMPVFSDEDLEWARRWAGTLRAETDKALLGEFGPVLARWGIHQEWMYTMAADPDYVRAFYDRKIENLLANIRLLCRCGRGQHRHHLAWSGFRHAAWPDDLTPGIRRMVAPYYKRLFDWVHANTPWKVFFHCCGAIYPIIAAHRVRRGHPEPGADQRGRHGPGAAEGGVRRPAGLLGRRR